MKNLLEEYCHNSHDLKIGDNFKFLNYWYTVIEVNQLSVTCKDLHKTVEKLYFHNLRNKNLTIVKG